MERHTDKKRDSDRNRTVARESHKKPQSSTGWDFGSCRLRPLATWPTVCLAANQPLHHHPCDCGRDLLLEIYTQGSFIHRLIMPFHSFKRVLSQPNWERQLCDTKEARALCPGILLTFHSSLVIMSLFATSLYRFVDGVSSGGPFI